MENAYSLEDTAFFLKRFHQCFLSVPVVPRTESLGLSPLTLFESRLGSQRIIFKLRQGCPAPGTAKFQQFAATAELEKLISRRRT